MRKLMLVVLVVLVIATIVGLMLPSGSMQASDEPRIVVVALDGNNESFAGMWVKNVGTPGEFRGQYVLQHFGGQVVLDYPPTSGGYAFGWKVNSFHLDRDQMIYVAVATTSCEIGQLDLGWVGLGYGEWDTGWVMQPGKNPGCQQPTPTPPPPTSTPEPPTETPTDTPTDEPEPTDEFTPTATPEIAPTPVGGGYLCAVMLDYELLAPHYAQIWNGSSYGHWDGWTLVAWKGDGWEVSLWANAGSSNSGKFLISGFAGQQTVEVNVPPGGGTCWTEEVLGQGGGSSPVLPEIQDWWWEAVYSKDEAELIHLRVSNIFEDQRDPAFCWEHAPEKPPAWVLVRIMDGEELVTSFTPAFIETERRPDNISCWEWEFNLEPEWYALYDVQFTGVPLITERVDISLQGMEVPVAGWWNIHEEGLVLYPGDDESLLSAEMNTALDIEIESEVAKVEAETVVEYEVQSGDTLSGICAQSGANQMYGPGGCVETLQQANGLNSSLIMVGQKLIVPQS